MFRVDAIAVRAAVVEASSIECDAAVGVEVDVECLEELGPSSRMRCFEERRGWDGFDEVNVVVMSMAECCVSCTLVRA